MYGVGRGALDCVYGQQALKDEVTAAQAEATAARTDLKASAGSCFDGSYSMSGPDEGTFT